MTRNSMLMIAVAATFAAGGCAKKAPNDLPPPPACCGPADEDRIVPGSQRDFLANISSDRVYFGYDQFNIDAEDMATLRSQAAWLARYPGVRVTVEGHADERGTRDYNIALGERRANAAKNYLASLGVDPDRMGVISYGKERPAAAGSNEEAYAQNRRAVTLVIER
ncbi:peptidoglycan-associated lipoprotein [Sphingopyxis panaciterrae]|uniref:peptidoglycan-associated lipoprotein Pal n=1 Tax=Sphingopyxis panaciterrae TaxID=363841 RepID=UPI001422F293|nr:peptidoglycan-associated lipoprotein Pal [Sphingopyxis panaciterrae]NIJ39560.1 peptidoglycan-associated lipoprotein [Sphingopyxis panaciterrae]